MWISYSVLDPRMRRLLTDGGGAIYSFNHSALLFDRWSHLLTMQLSLEEPFTLEDHSILSYCLMGVQQFYVVVIFQAAMEEQLYLINTLVSCSVEILW